MVVQAGRQVWAPKGRGLPERRVAKAERKRQKLVLRSRRSRPWWLENRELVRERMGKCEWRKRATEAAHEFYWYDAGPDQWISRRTGIPVSAHDADIMGLNRLDKTR